MAGESTEKILSSLEYVPMTIFKPFGDMELSYGASMILTETGTVETIIPVGETAGKRLTKNYHVDVNGCHIQFYYGERKNLLQKAEEFYPLKPNFIRRCQ